MRVCVGVLNLPCSLADTRPSLVKACTISGKHDHEDGCVVVSSPRAPSTSHDPIITTRREGHLHMWLFDSVTMPEADRHRAALDLTVTELIKQPSGNGTSADAVVSNRTTYPQMLRFNVRRDADYQITLQRRHDGEDGPISSDNDLTPFALFVSMPRDCNAMPQPCYGHGECSPVTGTCTCPPPFYGPLCADRTDDPDKDLPGKWWLWQWLYGSAARERPHLIAAVIGTSLAYVLLLALISVTIVCVDWESVANRWRQWRCARRRVYIDAEAEPLLQDSDNGDIGEYPSTNSTRVPSVDMLHEVQVEDRQAPLLFGPK